MLTFERLLLATLVFQTTRALPFFNNGTIPANLTTTCANALLVDVVQCPITAAQFLNGFYYPPTTLEQACSSACSLALQNYEASVKTACAGQTWAGYDDENDAPLDMIPNLMRYNRDLACIQDSGRWCNVVAAAAAIQADPGRTYNCPITARRLTCSRKPVRMGQYATYQCAVFGTLRLVLYQEPSEAGWVALLLWTTVTIELSLPVQDFELRSGWIPFEYFDFALVNVRSLPYCINLSLLTLWAVRKLQSRRHQHVLAKSTLLSLEMIVIRFPRPTALGQRGYCLTTILLLIAVGSLQVVSSVFKMPARSIQ
ncbi:hypothetical protein J1614_008518 [Plenodomus biglobosus]|nr:hypothetical protein J1614_008518 [Plenodomus biglobosus]